MLAKNLLDWYARGGYEQADETTPKSIHGAVGGGGTPTKEYDTPVVCACMLNPYSSIDPAPPHPAHANKTDVELGDMLCDAVKKCS